MAINWQTAFYMALNFAASVGIIIVNNYVFKKYNFKFGTLLTGIHFTFTFLGLLICRSFGMFTIKRVPIRRVLPLCFAFVGFVVFNNLSLQYNPVGVYQLFKVLTTPAIVAIQLVAYGVKVHWKLQAALVPVCIGVALATTSDVELNFWGLVHAVMGIITTSFYQIWVKTQQQDLQLDSYQLLFLQAPISAVMVFMLSLANEPIFGPTGWAEYEYSIPSLSAIILSSVLAFMVNLSIFLVIGKTSPVAYNVLGHFKLCVILLSGFLLFGEDTNSKKVMGTLMTLAGVITYTHFQQNLKTGWEARDKNAAAQASATQQQALLDKEANGSSIELESVKGDKDMGASVSGIQAALSSGDVEKGQR